MSKTPTDSKQLGRLAAAGRLRSDPDPYGTRQAARQLLTAPARSMMEALCQAAMVAGLERKGGK